MAYKSVRDRKQGSKKKERQNPQEKPISYIDLFKLVCVQSNIVSVEYFLDKMKPYELQIICESLHLRTKDSWEQSRLIAYLIAQTNSKKKLKPTDVIKFPWENDKSETQATKQNKPLTLEDVEQIKLLALQREKKLKEQGII